MLNIEEPYLHKYAFLQLAFRPFFLIALASGGLLIFVWMLLYLNGWPLPVTRYPTMLWHAHEMVFGYSMAVVAGFLLTAIKNWTNRQTLNKGPLLGLVALWLAPRLLPFSGNDTLFIIGAGIDVLFGIVLFLAALYPLVKAKQWAQAGISSKLLMLTVANLAFYLGLLGVLDDGGRTGLYAGFYLLLALVLTMARRLIPFFIEKGIDETFQAKNYKWIDISSLVLFLLFAISDLIAPWSSITASLALAQFLLHSMRVTFWYHPGLWKKSLLWVIYCAYAWITIGFLLKALAIWAGISPYLAIHCFAYGGIGMITLGMMARVSLGHTGRSVFKPPTQLNVIFMLLAVGSVFRIVLPLINSSHYQWWIVISQVLWILAFFTTFVIYFPMLIKARVDRRPG